MIAIRSLLSAVLLSSISALAQPQTPRTSAPQAPLRTHLQNYKDMVLATCVATAYRQNSAAASDAASTVSALRDWTEYDLHHAPDAMKQLVDRFLARDYRNPLAEAESPGQQFNLLKCLDLYHSSELDAQAKRLVMRPKHSSSKDSQTR